MLTFLPMKSSKMIKYLMPLFLIMYEKHFLFAELVC